MNQSHTPSFLTGRVAAWSARHRWWVTAAAILTILLAAMAMGAVETKLQDGGGAEGESAFASDLIEERFGSEEDPAEQLVFSNAGLDVDDPAFRQAVEAGVARLRALPQVGAVVSYYETNDPSLVSEDRHVVLTQVHVDGDIEAVLTEVDAIARDAAGFEVAMAGQLSLEFENDRIMDEDFARILFVSLGLGLVILVIAFRALVAAVIPLALALGAIFTTMGIAALVSQVYELNELYAEMVLLMGLAVGIDYSLFVVSRYRRERAAGREKHDAIAFASDTTGRAVFYAGITVVLSIAGLALTNNPIFISLSLGAIIVVLVAIIGSLTLLPALLAVLGDNVNRLTLPIVGRSGGESGGVWGRVVEAVLNRPAFFAITTAAALLLLAAPVTQLNLGFSTGADAYPDAIKGKRALELLDEHFAVGLTQPAVVVVDAPDVTAPAVREAVARLLSRVESEPIFTAPFETSVSPNADLLFVRLPINADADDERSEAAVRFLRDDIIPQAFAGSGAGAFVTGATAGSMDFTDHMLTTAPYVFGFVLGFAFLLLLLMFRSIIIPLKAIALNLLSVAAAYGVLVLVFQHGIGQGLLGFESTDRVAPWLPLFLFAILFGLSMDYHMLVLNRIKEAYDQGFSNEQSMAVGIRATAGTITSAAAIMVGVFASFALASDLELKQFGVGLGVAVFLDATIIRVILLPASMKLLGDRNWYLPSWLSWLPRTGGPRRRRSRRAAPAGLLVVSSSPSGQSRAPSAGAGSTERPWNNREFFNFHERSINEKGDRDGYQSEDSARSQGSGQGAACRSGEACRRRRCGSDLDQGETRVPRRDVRVAQGRRRAGALLGHERAVRQRLARRPGGR